MAGNLAYHCPLLVLTVLAGTGRLQPRVERDTQTYREFDWSSLPAALADLRTIGYPLFLKAVELIDRSGAAIPVLQWAVQTLAAWIFYGGLRAAGLRPWPALAATLPLFCSRSVMLFVPCIISDALAISWLWPVPGVCSPPWRTVRGRWPSAAGLFTFLTYQVRRPTCSSSPCGPSWRSCSGRRSSGGRSCAAPARAAAG